MSFSGFHITKKIGSIPIRTRCLSLKQFETMKILEYRHAKSVTSQVADQVRFEVQPGKGAEPFFFEV